MFALKSYLNVPDPNAPPPKWLSSLDSTTPSKALVFGMIMMATNFTTLGLYVSGLKEIVVAQAGDLGNAVAFVLLFSIVVSELAVPIGIYAVAPAHTSAILGSVLEWLEKNNRGISLMFSRSSGSCFRREASSVFS